MIGKRSVAWTLVAASGLVLGVTTPVQAATSHGCGVAPLAPNNNYATAVRYSTAIACPPNRTVTLQVQVYEQDDGPDTYLGGGATSWSSGSTGGKTVVGDFLPRPDTEPGNEEVYQRVRYRVSSGGAVWAWSAWSWSPVTEIVQDASWIRTTTVAA